ncbi:hypothetical protein CsSME_00044609 [Camellia sinensis var. sinensis]
MYGIPSYDLETITIAPVTTCLIDPVAISNMGIQEGTLAALCGKGRMGFLIKTTMSKNQIQEELKPSST